MTSSDDPSAPPSPSLLPRHLCRVMGLNQNYTSRSGTTYHVQVEDRGPVFDDASESWVRRVNVIAYANYGEPTARIVYGRDHDLPDVRTHSHNREVGRRVQELAAEVVGTLEEREQRQVARIQSLLRRYYETRDEAAKQEFEQENAVFPLVFARAFQELKAERTRTAEAAAAVRPPAAGLAPAPEPDDIHYPLDAALRDLVLEIERIAGELQRDIEGLRARGAADDILQSTVAKLVARARESLTQRHGTEFANRHLEMTRNSLVTAYRQVHARLARLSRP
ncbi:MAG TPA: hypothetical protein VMX54_04880 [Vicinamibacteria bacterium]|nr:hypothetical protein [Vicinamibacteria bacterium]